MMTSSTKFSLDGLSLMQSAFFSQLASPAFHSVLLTLCRQADQATLKIYHQNHPVEVDTKSDNSPVTQADKAAHAVLDAGLPHILGDELMFPVMSEENPDSLSLPREASTYWLIDPLDGTKEFIKKSKEFTVNIALIHEGQTIFGMVTAPVLNEAWWGGEDIGAWHQKAEEAPTKISVKEAECPIRVVASKSHLNQETQDFIAGLGEANLVQAGSSLKICRIAEGNADIYPRLGPTCEWDTAAAHAVIEGAGGSLTQFDGSPLVYGKENILNPFFIAKGK